MKQICDIEQCTGCHACFNACPKHSIEMATDDYGFHYPRINEETCIDCGRCISNCPVLQPVRTDRPISVYAAINKEHCDYETATSGGIATLFARKVLQQGGVVYGAAVREDLQVKHVRVTTDEGVEQIKGSKYVQSLIGNKFSEVQKDLEDDKVVLFIGTPCQIAGLKKTVQKKSENLITCDIVCHGVPSTKFLEEHITNICDFNGVDCISFRDKEGFYLTLHSANEVCYRKKNFYDIFYLGFLKGLFYRESCYSCKFANADRVGDITLGDFWGFDNSKGDFPVVYRNGLSLVMVNNERGQNLFNICTSEMIYAERELEEAINGNKQLRHSSSRHKNYFKFRNSYLKVGFEKAAKRALWKERIIYAILDRLGK